MKNKMAGYLKPRRLTAAGVVLLSLLFVGCEAQQPTDQPEIDLTTSSVAQAPTGSVSRGASPLAKSTSIGSDKASSEENPNMGDAIKLGMSYTQLQKSMGANGWVPLNDASCRVNMIGPDHQKFCAEHPDSERCGYCDQLAGLRQCSADGFCLFVFENAGQGKQLEIGMQGELENWKHEAPDTMFGVSGWRFK